jgi:hypothetical protein
MSIIFFMFFCLDVTLFLRLLTLTCLCSCILPVLHTWAIALAKLLASNSWNLAGQPAYCVFLLMEML